MDALNVKGVKKYRVVAAMSMIISISVLVVAFIGIFDNNIYREVFLARSMPIPQPNWGLYQDIISILFAVFLLSLSIYFLKTQEYKVFIGILGLLTYFIYAYGIYVIQGMYTYLYLIYLLIFGLSIYGLIFGFVNFDKEVIYKTFLSKAVRICGGVFLIFIILALAPNWILEANYYIKMRVPSEIYSVLILDLCLVFPAFGITAVKLFQNKPIANILLGVMLIKILTVCLLWGVEEWMVTPVDYPLAIISTVLVVISIVSLIIYFLKLKIDNNKKYEKAEV